MNSGFLDRTLLIAILAAIGGLYWQMFDVGQRLSAMEVHVSNISQQLMSVEEGLDTVEDDLDTAADSLASMDQRLFNVETALKDL